MNTLIVFLQILTIINPFVLSQKYTYEPNWDSLDKRPLPNWYDDSKVGIFIHWGIFSVPSFRSEWFWWDWQGNPPQQDVVQFMNKNYPPDFTYADFAKDFKAEFYDPDKWADLFQQSGAKYVVLTSKHHEGFCNWPSVNSWNWNSMDVGPHRDLIGELANSIRKRTNVTFGLYHSLFEWFNPIYLNDKKSGFKSQDFVKTKTMPELYDLVNKYKPEVIWSDGEWETSDSYWNSTNFIAWLYNESPVKDTVVVNDRWGAGDLCKHGDYYTCTDRFNPGKLVNHKWENAMTLDTQSWGFRRDMQLTDVITIEDLIALMVETVSCGGNILINIGPTKEGIIVPIFEERLKQLGSWLKINGESIYSTKPWKYQNDTTNSNVWYTSNNNIVYAILLKYPTDTLKVKLSAPKTTSSTKINLIGYKGDIQWIDSSDGIVIDLSTINPTAIQSEWAWAFRLIDIQ